MCECVNVFTRQLEYLATDGECVCVPRQLDESPGESLTLSTVGLGGFQS